MKKVSTKQLAVLAALLPATVAIGCNAHPLKEVEYQHGGIELDDAGDESGDFGDDDDGEDFGDDGADGDADGGTLPPADDGADDGDDGGTPLCTTTTIDVTANPPEVMLVLDKSGSMTSNTWQFNGSNVTRWNSLYSVTDDVLSTYEETMNFGALLFPAIDAGGGGFDNMCRLGSAADVATGPGNAQTILDAIPGAHSDTHGATPTRAAIELATAELAAVQTQGTRAMVLVTDGLANCINQSSVTDFDDGVPSVVADALDQQISTYVIGIDIRPEGDGVTNANAQEELDKVARAGGVPASSDVAQPGYYDAADEDALYDALDEIAARVECTIPLPAGTPSDAVVSIEVDGASIDQIGECADGDGWRFTDGNENQIELCNAACDALRVTGTVQTTACEPGDDEPEVPTLPVP